MNLSKIIPVLNLVLGCFFVFQISNAQQDVQYSQYMLNPLPFNAAYAGSREVISISALYRAQWLGVDGSPTTQNLAVHAPVWRRVGLGLSIVNDDIGNGTQQFTEFNGAFSYTLPMDRDLTTKLAFGLSFNGTTSSFDLSRLRVSGSSLGVQESSFFPNFGIGFLLRNPSYYIGISNPSIFENTFLSSNLNEVLFMETSTWYAIGGYIFKPFSNWEFKPATLIRILSGSPLQVDLSLTTLFKEKVVFGTSYRYGASFSAIFGYHLSPKFYFGLSYDNEISDFGGQNFYGNSLEFFLRYEFEDRKCKCSPRPRFY